MPKAKPTNESSGIAYDEWRAALADAIKPDDKDAVTVVELATILGVNRIAAYRHVRKLVVEGRAVSTFKVVHTPSGYVRHQPAYRLVRAAGKKG